MDFSSSWIFNSECDGKCTIARNHKMTRSISQSPFAHLVRIQINLCICSSRSSRRYANQQQNISHSFKPERLFVPDRMLSNEISFFRDFHQCHHRYALNWLTIENRRFWTNKRSGCTAMRLRLAMAFGSSRIWQTCVWEECDERNARNRCWHKYIYY